MKVKTVLKSLLFAYAITGVFLLFLAFLLFSLNLGEGAASAGITAVYVLSCLLGGFSAGKMMRREKYFWGLLVGAAYFVLLLAVSFAAKGRWDMSLRHGLTTLFLCIGGGALGGMLA